MELSSQLPSPIIFNGLKHHRLIILKFIKKSKEKNYPIDTLNLAMKKIGNSMIDLYHGDLKPQDISDEIVDLLKLESNFYKDAYYKYVSSVPEKTRKLKISDGSSWILLPGTQAEKYIHIHPARASKHTIRIKSISLKTAIFIKIFYDEQLTNLRIVALANEIRQKYLSEPPLKNELYIKGAQRALCIMR